MPAAAFRLHLECRLIAGGVVGETGRHDRRAARIVRHSLVPLGFEVREAHFR